MAPAWIAAKDTLAPDRASWRAVLYDPADDAGLDALFASGAVREVHDTLLDQVGELVEARDPARRYTAAEREAAARALLGGPAHRYGRWAFYPWSGRLVHVLPPHEHRELRTDRNRYKITAAEQDRLATTTLGVIGLSVGQAAALTLALEGIGGRLRLADFDTLALSNLNRLRAGLHELGLPKVVLAAREIAELDPYLPVEIFPAGVAPDTLDTFLDGLDLLVEECDDLLVKVLVRERARARRVPVLMDTSDRGLLDIERFDLEPDRPILHGLVGDLRADQLRGLATKDKVPYVLRILGADTLSPRFAASLPEIRETVSTWPQLASGVALGGALVADTARRILLGELTTSGRFHVDLEALVGTGAGVLHAPAVEEPPEAPLAETLDIAGVGPGFGWAASLEPVVPGAPGPSPVVEPAGGANHGPEHPHPLPPRGGGWRGAPGGGAPEGRANRASLVKAATLAPSGHNAQPWRFRWAGETLEIRLDPTRRLHALDFRDGGAWVAIGAAALNAALAARAGGHAAEPTFVDTPDDPHARVVLGGGPAAPDPLAQWIGRRLTNRRLGARVPLGDDAARLVAAASVKPDGAAPGVALHLTEAPAALALLGEALGAGDRLSWLFEPLHHEIVHGLRWTPSEVAATRDGLDVATLALSASDLAGTRVLARWPNARMVARVGGGRALEQGAKDQVAASSAVGLLIVEGEGPGASFTGGVAMQRMWLTATALGLAIHPVTTLPYLFARHRAGETAAWPADIVARIVAIEARFREVYPYRPGTTEALLFRVAHAPPATARSVRRGVESVLDAG